MCGIFGWQKKSPAVKSGGKFKFFARMLAFLNDERGGDSWGVYNPEADTLVKGLGLVGHSSTVKKIHDCPSLLGHTRAATTGKVTTKNAHPFKFKRVVGAHNGIVYNHLDLNWHYSRDLAVDSAHIFAHLNAGHKLDDIEAYGAIEYVYRQQPGRIYLGNFHSGILSVAELEGVGMVWSSSQNHLWTALEIAGLGKQVLFCGELKSERLYFVQGGELYETKRTINIAPPQQ